MEDSSPPLPSFNLTFRPHPFIRNPHLQTIISSLWRGEVAQLGQTDQVMILDVGDGVRLQGIYSPQPSGRANAVVLLLHGWLGNAHSNYILTLGKVLYRHGYSVFRLNLRDHGNTHQLNPGIFRGDLLAETFAAAERVAQLEPNLPCHIIGASLGGNFALRLAWRHRHTPLPNLGQVLAICPAIDPHQTTLALDHSLIYLAYFRRKWRKGFQKKQAAFPELYDFSEELAASTCMEMSEIFARNHSPYPDALNYFKSYTITPAMMSELQTPTVMLVAADDPIIPVNGFNAFHNVSPWLQLSIQPYGGHVGFIDIFPPRGWLCQAILAILKNKH